MSKSRTELDNMLDELERDLTMLVMDNADQEDLWTVFAGQADSIEASAGDEDITHVRSRMNAILSAKGIIQPDSEEAD